MVEERLDVDHALLLVALGTTGHEVSRVVGPLVGARNHVIDLVGEAAAVDALALVSEEDRGAEDGVQRGHEIYHNARDVPRKFLRSQFLKILPPLYR